ncbi:MAG: hypothetical protein LM564_00760 [Desulfurococcaceae archaeon]|nr:hypothetical protein [Desulfurococcaceae archaeon]
MLPEVDREHRVMYVKLMDRGRKSLCASRSLAWQRVSGLLRKRVKDYGWSWHGVEVSV